MPEPNAKLQAAIASADDRRGALLALLLYTASVLVIGAWLHYYVDRTWLRNIIDQSGSAGIVVFILVEYVYILLVPFYNTPIHLASGYFFGGTIGFVLNVITTTAALLTIIALVKRYGRSMLVRVVSERVLLAYDKFTEAYGPLTLFLVYVLPGFPDDEITYMLAASGRVSFLRFLLPVILGNLSKATVSFIGDRGMAGFPAALGSRIVVLFVGIILIGIQERLVLSRIKNII